MSASIFYKEEELFVCSPGRLDTLREKMISIAKSQNLDPNSNLMMFIQSLEYSQIWDISYGLNSKEEVQILADIVRLSFQSLPKKIPQNIILMKKMEKLVIGWKRP